MSKDELLMKIANAAIEYRRAQAAVNFHNNEHHKQFGRFWRRDENAQMNHKDVVVPARVAVKNAKRVLDGYLFMYDVKQWAVSE